MATTMTITTPGLQPATVTANDDVKAQELMRRFALATGAAAEWGPQKMLNHVAQTLRNYVVAVGTDHWMAEQNLRDQAKQAVGFE
jgi:hypothetical protein